jgi:CRP/FNR family transcriptional regulator
MLDERKANRIDETALSCDHEFDLACQLCRLRALCLPAALAESEIAALERVIDERYRVSAQEHVYRAGEEFTAIFAIVSGAVKTYESYRDGRVSVTGCHLPGELFGFSGIDSGRYSLNARALEETWVCELPFDQLETACREVPEIQSRLLHLMSERIVSYQQHLGQLMGTNTAQKRMSMFLLSLSYRSARRGESPTTIRLPMTGQDIGNYLGISAESVSREFTQMVKANIIAKTHRDVTILDLEKLRSPVCRMHCAV